MSSVTTRSSCSGDSALAFPFVRALHDERDLAAREIRIRLRHLDELRKRSAIRWSRALW